MRTAPGKSSLLRTVGREVRHSVVRERARNLPGSGGGFDRDQGVSDFAWNAAGAGAAGKEPVWFARQGAGPFAPLLGGRPAPGIGTNRSEEHTSELQSPDH